jgi:hypothetical protein
MATAIINYISGDKTQCDKSQMQSKRKKNADPYIINQANIHAIDLVFNYLRA